MADRKELQAKAEAIFREVLDVPDLKLRDDLAARDLENWDSLNHITLVMSLEESFEVKFSTREVMGWRNVGEMLDTLVSKLA